MIDEANNKASESGKALALLGYLNDVVKQTAINDGTAKNKPNAVLPDKERELLRVLRNGDEKPRRDIEPAIGSTYCPNEVKYLRDFHGFELPCRMINAVNRYGKPCRYGLYRLTAVDLPKAQALLGDAP